ncbi:sigma-E factor regulatory protein RseB domain-containing protein [Streptomyces sp. HNM0645]|uniref:LolA family protein n=1 Tax=Streptomyces sp. HNM0645 TaxID=2782343 RepID=UPI0024B74069|nr:sigma-E factor regulatory protein RseB domain-containing protein [Streptomyces sp. HNM0645]MDI9888155.1 sigma-E factor regulatory protein RseB domain-containing protein [Streptomyces sp. HNM0645]
MAPNDTARTTDEAGEGSVVRRKAARYAVPVAVAGVAAATIGLVPALAASGDPDLPDITAQELIARIAASDTEQLSGTVKISTDLGLPSLGGLVGGAAGSLVPGGGDGGSSASPEARLMELASGTHTLRIAADGPDRQKLSILGEVAEYSVIHNGDDVWAYDSGSDEVFHGKDAGAGAEREQRVPKEPPATPKDLADEVLKAAGDTTSVTVDGTARIAGRDAYQLLVEPKQSGSTVDSVRIAVDAENGVPLKFTLLPSGGGKAVVDAGFTKVDFSRPAASTFDFTPPKGAKVTEADELNSREKGEPKHAEGLKAIEGLGPAGLAGDDGRGVNVIGEGWTAIAEITTSGGKGSTAPKPGDAPPEAQQFLDALGDRIEGDFGTGTVFKTRLVNALMTDDGKVYVGAVTQDALVKAANAAK